MTFNELDKRAIEWNQIANGHRGKLDRMATQVAMCKEEMVKEFLSNEFNLMKEHYEKIPTIKDNTILFLDDYADSRFVYTEYKNLNCNFIMVDELFKIIHKAAINTLPEGMLIEAYHRVIESNFSKFVQSDDMTLEQAILESNVISLAYNCKCDPELINDYWVFRDQNGKIRKPSTFKPVDLSDLI